jgi:integrase/recombinase XerD
MKKYNPKNERIKREYYKFLREADRKAESTIDGIRKSILRFESYNCFKDFATFNKEQAIGFKKHLTQQKALQSGAPLSRATVLSTMNHLQAFLKWLYYQDGYKSRIHIPDIEYFNLSEKEVRTAKSKKLRDYPSLEQIRTAVERMPTTSDIEKRNRALVAFTILTGMRDSAITSLRLKHVDIQKELVKQYPDEVKTKFSKTIITYFFPVGDDFKDIVVGWLEYLTKEKLFSPNDPLFPKTKVVLDDTYTFTANGLSKEFWGTATPIRQTFKDAFQAAGLPYFNPHSFRHTLAHVAERYCTTPEQFKAWSQNLGHENVLTTFTSYGNIDPYKQGEVLKGLKITENTPDKADLQAAIRLIQSKLV